MSLYADNQLAEDCFCRWLVSRESNRTQTKITYSVYQRMKGKYHFFLYLLCVDTLIAISEKIIKFTGELNEWLPSWTNLIHVTPKTTEMFLCTKARAIILD